MNRKQEQSTLNPRLSLMAIILSVVLALVAAVPYTYADKPSTAALVTDKADLPMSKQFGAPNRIALTNSGAVFFTSGSNTALFRSSAGARTRLLQAGDAHPGFA